MQYLLFIHIIADSISLIAAALAVLSSKGKKLTDCKSKIKHDWEVKEWKQYQFLLMYKTSTTRPSRDMAGTLIIINFGGKPQAEEKL